MAKWRTSKKTNQKMPVITGRSTSAGGLVGHKDQFEKSEFRPNPAAITVVSLPKQSISSPASSIVSIDSEGLDNQDLHDSTLVSRSEIDGFIKSRNLAELVNLWHKRDFCFEFQDDALSVLATIRFLNGTANHLESFEELSGSNLLPDLPWRVEIDDSLTIEESPQIKGESKDKRYVTQTIPARDGQTKFRRNLIDHYGSTCMITGENVEGVIEAAHITPFSESQSNIISNGLLLRADVHRLFDINLITIEPETFIVHVHPSIRHSSYGVYHGKPLIFHGHVLVDNEALRKRFKLAVGQV